jgi:hypothetical protein
VLPGLEKKLRRAEHGLSGKKQSGISVEPDLYAAIGERIDDEHHIGRAASAETGDGVEEPFVEHDHPPDGLEELTRDSQIILTSMVSSGDRGRPGLHHGGCVGHRSDDACFGSQAPFEAFECDSRRYGHYELVGMDVSPYFGQDPVDDLGFDREHENVRFAHELVVVGGGPNAMFRSELLEPLDLDVARQDAGWSKPSVQEPLDQGTAHVPGAQETQSLRLHIELLATRRELPSYRTTA